MDSGSSTTDSLLKFLSWLEKNKKRVSLITGAVVLGVGIIAAIFYYQSQKEVRASEALSNIRTPFNPATPLPPETVQAHLKIAHDFGGTRAAGRALVEAAAIFYTQGSYTDAETQYRRFLSEYPDSPFLPQGMLGLASTLDAEGKTAEATAKYEELRRRFPTDSVIDETKLALARIYEKQNPTEAYKLYSELSGGASSQTGIGSEAGIRLADLMEKYPDLKTNSPSAAVVPPAKPTPQVTTTKARPTNQMVMTITNPPATNKTATGASTTRPLLLKPEISTNKTP